MLRATTMAQDLHGLPLKSAVMWVRRFNPFVVENQSHKQRVFAHRQKNKSKPSWNFARVVIVSVTYLMYIPRITMVGEDAVDTTSMM